MGGAGRVCARLQRGAAGTSNALTLEVLSARSYLEDSPSNKRSVSMISRLLLATMVVVAVALTACEKSEESATEHMAPATGAVEEGKSATVEAPEAAKEEGEKPSE
jgi:hypothetical protein